MKISSCTLVEPTLHDGNLAGISTEREDTVDLYVTDTIGKRFMIRMGGVVDFVATDFRQGNIILDVTIMKGAEAKLEVLSRLSSANSQEARRTFSEELIERVMRESLYVVWLNPSYGCQAVCVARTIVVDEVQSAVRS